MQPDLKHFYECTIDLANAPEDTRAGSRYTLAYKLMLDTHPHCEELLDEFSEIAIELYTHSDGPAGQALAEQLNRIERDLNSNRLPW